MNQTETKSKNKSKKRDKPGRILNSPNLKIGEIERYYSVFGYHDYYIEEPEPKKIGLMPRLKLAVLKFFSWIVSFLNSLPV
jgi:hypothetical protein